MHPNWASWWNAAFFRILYNNKILHDKVYGLYQGILYFQNVVLLHSTTSPAQIWTQLIHAP